MNKKLIKNIAISGLLMVAVFGIGLYTNTIKLPITRVIDPMYVADFSNDRILVGFSHNVFVGKVVKEAGNEDVGIGPVTQFEVEVIQNIKGDLEGKVIVLQQGGYKNGILYVMHEGDVMAPDNSNAEYLLQQGSTYLFSTRYDESRGWYYLNSHSNASKLISSDGNLDNAQLQALVEKDEKVIKLQAAYKDEILLDTDVKNNNTRNSYQSLLKSK